MNKFHAALGAVVVAASLAGGAAAQAGTVTFTLVDIGTWDGYTNSDVSGTYAGDGYLGLYNEQANTVPAFAHLFGLEGPDYSRTVAQVGISALDGLTITSATLSFGLFSNFDGGSVTINGFGGDGHLGYLWDSPFAAYGSTTGGLNFNTSIDVTGIVAAAAGANEDWLGLHLKSNQGGNWTYSSPGGDEAQVRLTVNFASGAPEPATWAMMLVGFAGAGAMIRRARQAAVTA